MKKILLFITILLLTSACSSSYLKSINLKKLNEKLDNKETFVLYITDEDDSSITLKNTLYKVAKENKLKTYYLNINKLSDEELNNLKEIVYFEEANFISFIKEGQESTTLSRIENVYISQNDLYEELKLQEILN